MSQNGLPFWLKILDLCPKRKTFSSHYPSLASTMSRLDASADSFELVDTTFMTEEEAVAAQVESERLRIQEAEARLALQLPHFGLGVAAQ